MTSSEELLRTALTSPTVTLSEAARCLGISMPTAYRLVDQGEFPVTVRRVGGRYAIPSLPLLEFLGFAHGDAVRMMLGESRP